MMKNKRFIAGAHCPACKEVDKIFTYQTEEAGESKKYRACSRCDFLEELRFEDAPSELSTRVNRSRTEREQQTQQVRIVDPQTSKPNRIH